MTSSSEDGAGVVLASPLLGLGDGSGDRAVELDAWARAHEHRVVVLPEPGHRAHPDADAAFRRRLARADRRAIVTSIGAVRHALGHGIAPVAFVVAEEEVAGQAGRAWLQRVQEAADRAGLPLPRAVRIDLAAPLDTELLDSRVLAAAAS